MRKRLYIFAYLYVCVCIYVFVLFFCICLQYTSICGCEFTLSASLSFSLFIGLSVRLFCLYFVFFLSVYIHFPLSHPATLLPSFLTFLCPSSISSSSLSSPSLPYPPFTLPQSLPLVPRHIARHPIFSQNNSSFLLLVCTISLSPFLSLSQSSLGRRKQRSPSAYSLAFDHRQRFLHRLQAFPSRSPLRLRSSPIFCDWLFDLAVDFLVIFLLTFVFPFSCFLFLFLISFFLVFF